MDLKISNQELWKNIIAFIAIDILILIPLFFQFIEYQDSSYSIVYASMFFWGMQTIVIVFAFWNIFHKYIYPDWMRWILSVRVLLYIAVGFGLLWPAERLPGLTLPWFVLLGGVAGVFERIVVIQGLRILEKVPYLQDIKPFPVLVFSFFEYVFYWTLVAWLALRIGHNIL
jgi:hypothetical protein